MIIKRVRLENIRSYTNQEIVFPAGSVLLSGDIGSGKSTVLFAIEFALFGVRRKHLSGDSLLRKGKNSGSVELCFEVDGKEVIVKRSLKLGNGEVKQESGYVVIDGVKKEATPVELKSITLGILGYPKELVSKSKTLVYRYTVYTPQEEMKKILTDDKDSRLDTLRKVFGIDRYKRIRENCVMFTRSLKEIRNNLEGQIVDLEDKKKVLIGNEEQIKDVKVKCSAVKDKLDKNTGEIQIVENEMIDKEDCVKKLNKLKQDHEINEAKLNQKIELYSKDKERLKELEKKVTEIRGKISSINAEEFKNKEEDVEKAVLEKERALHCAMENTASIREELAFVMANIDEMKRSIDDNDKVEKMLKKSKEQLLIKKEKVKDKQELMD
ncbi:AAA family ATPase, partial [Nanoarchaeota archaeon]